MIDRNSVGLMAVLASDAVDDTAPGGESGVTFHLRVRRGVGHDGRTVLAPMFVRCRWNSKYAATLRPRLLAGTWLDLQGKLLVYQTKAMRERKQRPSTLVEVDDLILAPEPPLNAEDPKAVDRNIVMLSGRFGADAEFNMLESRTPSARFTLAVRRFFGKKAEGTLREEPMWVRCQWTDHLAMTHQEALTKGRWFNTQGRLHIFQTAEMRETNEPPAMVVAVDRIF